MTICLTCGWVFIATLSRFRFVKYNVFWLFNLVSLGLTVSANYRTHYPLWKFPVHWLYYGFIAVGAGMLASQFVFPVLAGNIIRAALGRSLRAVGSAFARAIELMTGEVDEATGLLAQRSGDTVTRTGIDEGLWQAGVSALYDDVTVAGAGINEIWKWQNAARYEWDAYRRQHWFPHAHFDFLAHLLRSTMNSFMMVVYPLQTGRMDCRVTRRHAGSLRALGGAVAGCCEALAAVLADGRPLAEAAPALEAMEARYEALVDEAERALLGASGADAALSARMVSYNMMVATFFTVCTRLRRMYLCSAGALGRDDPGALAVLERHFHPDQRAQRGADVGWHFATIMRRIHVGRGSLNSPLGLLRDSLLSEQSVRLAQKAGAPQQLQDYLKAWRPPVLKVMAVQEKESISRWARFLTWLRLRTGINTNHLALACQVREVFFCGGGRSEVGRVWEFDVLQPHAHLFTYTPLSSHLTQPAGDGWLCGDPGHGRGATGQRRHGQPHALGPLHRHHHPGAVFRRVAGLWWWWCAWSAGLLEGGGQVRLKGACGSTAYRYYHRIRPPSPLHHFLPFFILQAA